jgi:flagellar protein FlaF
LRYSEIEDDSVDDARARERQLFERSRDLLVKAKSDGVESQSMVEAIHFTSRFWKYLIQDLSGRDNNFETALRASTISIGIWMVKLCESIRQGESDNVEGLIEITEIFLGSYA